MRLPDTHGGEIVPQILQLDFGPRQVLIGSAGLRPLNDFDAMYRIASGVYGRSFHRPDRPWPLARPYIVGLRFGSPFETVALVDLTTLLAGAGGLGVLGLIRLLWGFDIDLRNRRLAGEARTEELRAKAAEHQARRAAALAELADESARRTRRELAHSVLDEQPPAPNETDEPLRDPLRSLEPWEAAVDEAVSDLPERYQESARRRLRAIARSGTVNGEAARGEVREPTPEEAKRLHLNRRDRPQLP